MPTTNTTTPTTYNPPRKAEHTSGDPIEIDLVYNVRACGTCTFFWPKDPKQQPYGPFPAFDFDSNMPTENKPDSDKVTSFPWVDGTTREEAFPNGEIMDGCRKAPIMTIGINPNLTAFAPGQQGTSWVYPSFTSDNGTDAWTKYAYYYRYRSVYQEHFDLDKVKQYLLPEGQIMAEKGGTLHSAQRTSESPNYDIEVLYDGDSEPTKISLQRELGSPRYVVLYNHFPPNNRFEKGDVIAGRLNIPAGLDMEVWQGLIGYYEQIVPALTYFEDFLAAQGCDHPKLAVGEDVCQLDMVACASPHWNEAYMGGQLQTVVNNCVSKNAWAMKQLVQTKPVILFLVGEASYNMFHGAFSKLLHRNQPLSAHPEDGAFTLFRETLDDADPTHFEFSTSIDGKPYSISTRIVVVPHFSYDTNYVAQFRMSGSDWDDFKEKYPDCVSFFEQDEGYIKVVKPQEEGYFWAVQILKDVGGVLDRMKAKYPAALESLWPFYYNPHKQMADVLGHLYSEKKLGYTNNASGTGGLLNRTEGSCHFCVNSHWEFPLGCPYDKTKEPPPPQGFLQEVAKQIIAAGRD